MVSHPNRTNSPIALEPIDFGARLERLQRAMHGANFAALVITDSRSLLHLLGASRWDFPLMVLTKNDSFVYPITDRSDSGKAHLIDDRVQVRSVGAQMVDIVRDLPRSGAIGFDPRSMTVDQHEELCSLIPEGVTLRDSSSLLNIECGLDAAAIRRITSAASLVDTLLDEAECAAETLSEIALAKQIDVGLKEMGASERLRKGKQPQIRTYVAYGENSADITHRPSHRHLCDQFGMVSAGAIVDGYWALSTRMLGDSSDPVIADLFEIVKHVYNVVDRMASAGDVKGANRAANVELRQLGAIGLAPHPPCIRIGSELGMPAPSKPPVTAMAVCIEPGLYAAGHGGVRIGRTKMVPTPIDERPEPPQRPFVRQLVPNATYFSDFGAIDAAGLDRHSLLLLGDDSSTCLWEGGY
jgi:Xaa-Pro aminopeptidase